MEEASFTTGDSQLLFPQQFTAHLSRTFSLRNSELICHSLWANALILSLLKRMPFNWINMKLSHSFLPPFLISLKKSLSTIYSAYLLDYTIMFQIKMSKTELLHLN